ncbi:MAG TPA: thioredoxin [Spirochaetota bacterium]|nr:thioredoxin [Spirochaetota bacterium]
MLIWQEYYKEYFMEHLNKQTFKDKIFDYEKEKEWRFKGDRPVIIDFYADWCGPCRIVAPILEELAREYEGRIDIYKINTEHESELAGAFGISSIPSILFIPVKGKPQMSAGALPKESFKEAIKSVLQVEESSVNG